MRRRSSRTAARAGRRPSHPAARSNAAKCRRSCAGVVMPAWCVAEERVARARRPRCPGSRPRSRRRRPPPPPSARPAAPAPARPRRPRRLRRCGSVGHRSIVLSGTQHGGGELRQRLGEGVDAVGQLVALRVGDLVVRREAVLDRAVLREQRLEGVELAPGSRRPARSSPFASAIAFTLPNATSAPCTLAAKSVRSVCDHQSSSPVILPTATSSSRPMAPFEMSARVTVKSSA